MRETTPTMRLLKLLVVHFSDEARRGTRQSLITPFLLLVVVPALFARAPCSFPLGRRLNSTRSCGCSSKAFQSNTHRPFADIVQIQAAQTQTHGTTWRGRAGHEGRGRTVLAITGL